MKNPLCEVFGYPTSNNSDSVFRKRKNKLCPFNNIAANCTKNSLTDPLGVCSVYHNDDIVIICPVRFRENWTIAEDAAEYFFAEGTRWTTLSEVTLKDGNNKSAGNIDHVLVAFDENAKIIDFGSLEVQAVYISGNISNPFKEYTINYSTSFSWENKANYPKPDFLSSSRKRLVPQLLFKGGILNSWNKKMCVAVDEAFFNTLPELPEVSKENSNVAWFIYELRESDYMGGSFTLTRKRTVYTDFDPVLKKITTPVPGKVELFINTLQKKFEKKSKDQEIETNVVQNPNDIIEELWR